MKLTVSLTSILTLPSFPSWERGLKLEKIVGKGQIQRVSFPSWERGLKPEYLPELVSVSDVVPLVGTWIETLLRHSKGTLAGGRSPRGNVD